MAAEETPMSDTVAFYYNPMSRARIVHWMLEEVGAKYELKLMSFDKKDQKDPAFLAINPMGKLPTIVHRGTTITETAAICAYLADAFPEARLAPALTDPARGSYYRWLFFGVTCVEQAINDRMMNREPGRPGALSYGTYDDTMNTLEKALIPGRYLLGNLFTAADVFMASAIGWGFLTKSMPVRPVFESYKERCSDRPAFKRFFEQSAKLMKK